LDFKQRTHDQYPELFSETNGQPDFSASAGFAERWGWIQSIYAMAKGDVLQFDNVTKLNINKALMFLSFEKEKNQLEAKLLKQKK
tara:strand:- start:537 stop:791 length:255 start_codon:yes stop_codon:yes gene_type:complete